MLERSSQATKGEIVSSLFYAVFPPFLPKKAPTIPIITGNSSGVINTPSYDCVIA